MKLKFHSIVFIVVTGLIGCNNESTSTLTKEQGDAILKELSSIRTLLEKQLQAPVAPKRRPPAPQFVDVDIKNRLFLGDENAPVTFVEFTDYECPFCRKFHLSSYNDIKKQYIDTGKMKYVVMDLPLHFHPNAKNAALAALCANDQDKYWELRQVFFENSKKLSRADIDGYAKELGIDVTKLNECMDSGKYEKQIADDVAIANRVGITGTPSFVLGKVEAGKTTFKGQKLVGAQPFIKFKGYIDKLIGDQKTTMLELDKAKTAAANLDAAQPVMKSNNHQLQGKIN